MNNSLCAVEFVLYTVKRKVLMVENFGLGKILYGSALHNSCWRRFWMVKFNELLKICYFSVPYGALHAYIHTWLW